MDSFSLQINTRYNFYFFIIIIICFFYGLQVLTIGLLTPDSFAYLDGAKNILNNSQYCYDANSQKITLFPPLYSLILAVIFKLIGIRALSVLLINTILYLIAILLLFRLRKMNSLKFGYSFFIFLLIAHTLFRTMNNVLSECLYIPLTICWLFIINSKKYNHLILIALTLILEIAMVSTRYAGILLIASWYLSLFLNQLLSGKGLKSFLQYQNLIRFVVPFFTLIYFVFLRNTISGNGPHHNFILGSGKYHFYEYFIQAINDIGCFFLGEAASFQFSLKGLMLTVSIIIIGIFLTICKITINRQTLLFIIICFSIHVLVLWCVWVDDGLSGRYFIWLYLILFVSAKLNWRQNFSPNFRIFCLAFVSFCFMANDVYYLTKNNIAVQQVEYRNLIGFKDFFETGYQKTLEMKKPEFKWHKNRRYLVSPCYSWNIPNSVEFNKK